MRNRFYFDLKNGSSIIRDHDGAEAHDLDQATEEARVVIQEMLRSGDLSEEEAGWMLIIRDAAREALLTLPVVPHIPAPVMVS